MIEDFIIYCADSAELKTFLTKSYGIEMLLCLEKFQLKNSDNGVDDTYECILNNKPGKVAFNKFCQILNDNGSITFEISKTKKSKKVIRLTDQAFHQMSYVREKQFNY